MAEWIEWGGGECPVADGTVVGIEFRNGVRSYADKASDYYWEDDGDGFSIIRYRVVGGEAEREPDTPVKTLRDEFAMAALTGLLAHDGDGDPYGDAAKAYATADAMLAARKESE